MRQAPKRLAPHQAPRVTNATCILHWNRSCQASRHGHVGSVSHGCWGSASLAYRVCSCRRGVNSRYLSEPSTSIHGCLESSSEEAGSFGRLFAVFRSSSEEAGSTGRRLAVFNLSFLTTPHPPFPRQVSSLKRILRSEISEISGAYVVTLIKANPWSRKFYCSTHAADSVAARGGSAHASWAVPVES